MPPVILSCFIICRKAVPCPGTAFALLTYRTLPSEPFQTSLAQAVSVIVIVVVLVVIAVVVLIVVVIVLVIVAVVVLVIVLVVVIVVAAVSAVVKIIEIVSHNEYLLNLNI